MPGLLNQQHRKMKRFQGLLSRTKSSEDTSRHADSPESNAARGVRLFCESGNGNNQGEEVTHLPVIVEAAESSPQAAAASAYQIRKFLSKDHYSKPHIQYNAIMLFRILAQNPGPSFTRNIDPKFVSTVRNLLRDGKDASVQQIMRETLDFLEAEKNQDPGLGPLLDMWKQTKGHRSVISPSTSRTPYNQPPGQQAQQYPDQRVFGRNQLPAPHELVSRVEESRNTAKILLQLIQSTPTEEVLSNDLIKEFAERCQSAQRSMQGYINCDSPPPDDDTLQTLIETNEQLSLSMSRYQRAMLSARRAAGVASPSPDPGFQRVHGSEASLDGVVGNGAAGVGPPPGPPPQQSQRHSGSSNVPFTPMGGPQRDGSIGSSTSELSPVSPESESSSYRPRRPYSPSGQQSLNRISEQSPVSSRLAAPHPEPARLAGSMTSDNDPFSDSAEPSMYGANTNNYRRSGHASERDNYGQRSPPRKPAPRPTGPGAYHQGATPSYLGRQESASNGLTMHGAGAVEVDTNSREGRLDTNRITASRDSDDLYDASPVEPRKQHQYPVYRY